MGSSKQLFMEVREAEEIGDQARQVLFGPSTGDYARQSAKLKDSIADYQQSEIKLLECFSRSCRNYHSATNKELKEMHQIAMDCYRRSLECFNYNSVQLDSISTDAYNAVNFGE